MAHELIPPVDLPQSATGPLSCGAARAYFSCSLDLASHGRFDVRVWRLRIQGSRTRVVVSFDQSGDRAHRENNRVADVDDVDAPVQLVLAARRQLMRTRVDPSAPDSLTRWTARLPGRDGAMDSLESGRAMLARRAEAAGRRDPSRGSV